MDECEQCGVKLPDHEIKYSSKTNEMLCTPCLLKVNGTKRVETDDDDQDIEDLPDDGEDGYF